MLDGVKNKFVVFISLFGAFNVIQPILTGTLYDPNNIILLGLSVIFFVYFMFLKKTHDISLLALVGVIMASFIILMLDSGGAPITYYTKWVIFTVSLLFYYIMIKSEESIDDQNYKLVYGTVLIQIVFFIIQSFSSNAYVVTRGGTYLILCFDNKNATALHILTLCCILALYAERMKIKVPEKKPVVPAIAFLLCLLFIYLTGSRSSLAGALFLLPFYFLPSLKKKITKPIMLTFVLLPFIFASIYVVLYEAGIDLALFGRTAFNGRENMWIPVFKGGFKDWFFGMYSTFTSPGGAPFQLHNGIVDLIASYGIIISIVFLIMVYKMLASLLESDNDTNRMVVICICSLIIQSIGEAALFNGTRAVYICMIMAFIERNYNNGIEQTNQGIM